MISKNWTAEEAQQREAEIQARIRGDEPVVKDCLTTARPAAQSHRRGEMNKTESLYAELLEARRQAGEIDFCLFEGITFHLANRCSYTPDILYGCGGKVFAVEVKACMKDGRILAKDDSMVKLKVAAKMFPWITWVLAARERDGNWREREIPS